MPPSTHLKHWTINISVMSIKCNKRTHNAALLWLTCGWPTFFWYDALQQPHLYLPSWAPLHSTPIFVVLFLSFVASVCYHRLDHHSVASLYADTHSSTPHLIHPACCHADMSVIALRSVFYARDASGSVFHGDRLENAYCTFCHCGDWPIGRVYCFMRTVLVWLSARVLVCIGVGNVWFVVSEIWMKITLETCVTFSSKYILEGTI